MKHNTNQVKRFSSMQLVEPQTPTEIIVEALQEYKLDSLYVLYSGGKDSSCVLDYVRKNFPKQFKGAVFTNVGLGSLTTRKFVIDYCHRNNIPLFMTWNHEGENIFYKLLLEHGFATKGSHRIWMGYLKYHSWYYFMRDYVRPLGQKACYISGVRKRESKQRSDIKKYSRKPIDQNATMTFVKPFLYKSGTQLWDYFIKNNLEKTPVYDWLNRSGECFCGSYTESWDLQMMKTHEPLAYETIKYYEKQIQLKGTSEAKLKGHWGEIKQSTSAIDSQLTFDSFLKEVNDDYCGESCQVDE